MRVFLQFCAAIAVLMLAQAARAEDFPARPIKILVGAPAGGTTDTMARAIADPMAAALKQPVLVENRPGAGGNLAAAAVAKSVPDGYTLLVSFSSHTINATLYPSLPYDPVADFTPITMIARVPSLLVGRADLPAKDLKELIALAKAQPHKLTIGIGGIGSSLHLAGEKFKLMTGVDLLNVPYKGTAPALTDLLGGQIQVSFAAIPVTMPHVKTGRLRAVAVTTAKRVAAIPDMPTIAETLPGYETILWYGVLGPKGLPREVLARWSKEVSAVLTNPDMKERIAAEGFEIGATSSARLQEVMKRDIAKWTKVVKTANIRVAQ